jgi:hypothetical protein
MIKSPKILNIILQPQGRNSPERLSATIFSAIIAPFSSNKPRLSTATQLEKVLSLGKMNK